ncbi:hypothetical protein M378DRAFT_21947 [Amanita muscaria Koide BX008]|uniref:Uncharacterized protein n=1 Tax=Amanita muscaria (strain Koide BX008) TaxID=946122 RepID=A0A0C2SY44_AMAMK|nr:hypothetical protein M378DRAFT_21947 [Amanita muscaria Koide BX008]
MAAPTHYIRTIQSSFAAHSTSAWGPHNVLYDLGGLINQYPPGLGFGPQEVPYRSVGRRRPPHSAPLEMPSPHVSKVMHVGPSRPPYTKFDPFADDAFELNKNPPSPITPSHPPPLDPPPPSSQLISRSTAQNSWPSPAGSRGNSGRAVSATPPPNTLNNRDARARLVAGILLNRVHGKPMRRRCFSGEPREYVKSRLSCVITADA